MPIGAASQPGQGSAYNVGRKRNTATNTYSKSQFMGGLTNAQSAISGGALPTLDPAAIANYYAQLDTLQSQLTNQLASLRAERVGFRGEAKVQKADVRQQGQTALTEGINASLERGVLGSSADVEGRIGTRAATQTGVASINRQLYDALAQNKLAAGAAALTAQQGAQQIAATAIGQRMTLQQQEEANALQMQIAQMQAQASRIQTAAELESARQQLAFEKQNAKNLARAANNPMTIAEWYRSQGLPVPQKYRTGTGNTYSPSNYQYPTARNG